MKLSTCFRFLTLLVLAALTSPCFAASEEKLLTPIDERNWKIGFQEYAYDQSLVEMVPKDQDILDWKELFTVQKFEDISMSAAEFAANLEKAFKKHITKDQKLVFERIEPKYLEIFESSFIYKGQERPKDSLIAFDEYNIGRVLKGKKALYYVRYSAKDSETFQKNKEGWQERLKLIYLAPEQKSESQGNWLAFTNDEVLLNDKKLSYDSQSRLISNDKARFSLSVPSTWMVEEQDQKETDFDEEFPYQLTLIFSDPSTGIYGGSAYHHKASKDEIKEKLAGRYEKIYKEQLPNIKIINRGTIQTVLGQQSLFLSLKENNDLGWVAFFETPERVYRIELWGPEDQSEKLKEDFYKLVTNFQMMND
ncbi:MAG: hypothetical protein LW832_03990 [Parachlamydia sp.]|nr:hypothetical protein [Parachlamydia sp.]